MSLFWQELRKIWRPGIVGAIILLGLIYYYMFPQLLYRVFFQRPLGPGRV